MLRFGKGKQRSFQAVWIVATVFLAIACKHARLVAKGPPPQKSAAKVVTETPEAAVVVDSVCDKILSGDFESAQEIVRRSSVPACKGLRQLRMVIDEYMAIKARRKASQNDAYQVQMDELRGLRQKGLSEDVNDIGKVFTVVIQALEYADEEGQKQALLEDPFVSQIIEKAKTTAAEFESKGKWLDAYTVCYSKLAQIHEDDQAYSDYAEQLLDKADIAASLRNSSCETSTERYAGIKKQMFISAVNLLDTSYVNFTDYRQMAIKGIGRCKLLAEVMSNSHLDVEYEVQGTQLTAWSGALEVVLDEVNQSPADISRDKFIDVFEEVLALNESDSLGMKLPRTLLIAKFAEGALYALDPHTVIYWPSQVESFEKAISNQFSGIGVRLLKAEGLIKIVSVLPNTPAYNCGLEVGDVITAVDSIETENMSSYCAAKSITGPEGTEVTLTIRRPVEDKNRDVTMSRAKIMVPSIHGWQRTETGPAVSAGIKPAFGGWLYMIDSYNKIGYVRITSFNSRTARDFEEVLDQLEAKGLKGLVLDLRSNPGGLLNSAVEIADKFIEEGLIVRTQPRFGMATYASAHKENTHPDYPIVILINRFTASSSEIVAGVLQDPKYNRATLVGERSYGKGSVQSVTSYPGGGARLKYTAAYYHLPSGQRIENREVVKKRHGQDWGISPNPNVQLRSDEMRRLADVQKANELLARADHDSDNAPDNEKQYSAEETIDADPQLAIGLLVLKSKMIRSGYTLTLN
ncbi:MAG: S41 family peptidase [Planctomycetota bacterium]|jgi:carboxyl-terminal processing protease